MSLTAGKLYEKLKTALDYSEQLDPECFVYVQVDGKLRKAEVRFSAHAVDEQGREAIYYGVIFDVPPFPTRPRPPSLGPRR